MAQVTEVRNVIVIGSGPSGYTAALYAARAELKPLVFEGSVTAGGALMQTTDVENFPGFPDAVMGPELMDSMRKQAERFGAELLSDDVIAVDLAADPKVVRTDSETYLARAVIIATGSRYKELGVPGEKELGGHGVSWCATCDGFFFRGHDIAVIGGGDSAMEEALFLTRFGKSVTVIHRRDTLRASKIMAERAFASPKITFVWDSEVVEVLGEGKVTGLRIRSTKDGTEQVLPVTGVFVAIGHDPRSDLFAGQLATDPDGYLLVDQPSTRTAIEGVFAAGDVADPTYRQAVSAAGEGCKAAIDAEPNIRALLIRDGDYFIRLEARVEKADLVNADLFVSIHADSFVKPDARGSSVFVLSERGATSAAARELANRENQSDLIGGVSRKKKTDRYVEMTKADLLLTAQINDSLKLGRAVLGELGDINSLHRGRVEQAGFAVLKAPEIPSILVETAFISNPDEERRLTDEAYQEKIARAILRGIKSYLAKNPPLRRPATLAAIR